MRWALVCYVLFILALDIAILRAGPVMQVACGHDFFVELDAGWKIVHGDRPFLDFPCITGALTPLILAAGVALTGPVPEAFPVALAISLLPVSALIWCITSRQLGPWFGLAAATFLAMVWVAPYPLHFTHEFTCYAMLYNRHAYVVLALLLVLLAGDRRPNWRLVGFAFGLLLFAKIPHFAAGLVLLASHLAFNRPTRAECLHALGGFLLVALPFTLYLGGVPGLVAMFSQFHGAATVRDQALVQRGIRLVATEMRELIWLFIGAVIFSIVLREKSPRPEETPSQRNRAHGRLVVEVLAVSLASVLAELGGSPMGSHYDIPTVGIYALILVRRAVSGVPWTWSCYRQPGAWSAAAVIFCCWFLFVPLWTHPFRALFAPGRFPGAWKKFTPSTVIDAPGYESLVILDSGGKYRQTFCDKINDGLDLIRRHPDLRQATIATLDFTDGFSCPLRATPPPGTPIFIEYGVNIGGDFYPRPDHFFQGCQVLMIPKIPDSDSRTLPFLLSHYQTYIDTHFSLRDQSHFWTLYVRN